MPGCWKAQNKMSVRLSRGLFPAACLLLLAPPGPAADPRVVNDGYGDYVLVPAGPFKMGDNFEEGDQRERPVHTVELDAFYIGKFEVTNAEFGKFRQGPGYDDAKFWPSGKVVAKELSLNWTSNRRGGGRPGNEGYAVMGITWEQAVAYCNWVSAK